jgi:hypothetical protein
MSATRSAAYSAAEAGVRNFTQWLVVHMAQEYSPEIRINANALGFFVGGQNRRLFLMPGLTSFGLCDWDHHAGGWRFFSVQRRLFKYQVG